MSEISSVCPCFTPGTLIATDQGQRPLESLRRGDKIVTRDNGLRRIYWIGRRDLTLHELRLANRLRPILIRAGALGEGRPARDMLVSPNHRFLLQLDGTEIQEGRDEALVAARHLVDSKTVKQADVLGVSYIHLLCDRHQVILANGAWTESFHPDDSVFRSLTRAHKRELMGLFPDIATIGASVRFPAARRIVEERSRFEK